MAYKIELNGDKRTLTFEGTLDRAALADLLGRWEAARRQGDRLRVWLRAGTQVEPGVLDELVRVSGHSLSAEAPFLARWIRSCVNRSGAPDR